MPGNWTGKSWPEPAVVYMKMKDLEKDSVRRLKIDDSADSQRLDNFLMARLKGVPKSRIYKLVRGGEVRINGGRVDVGYRMELVHRLDRETSGVLRIALKRRALTGLHAAMREGRIEKRYLTLVAGRWPNPVQHVKLPLHKRVTDEGEKRVTVRDEGQTAHTIFRRLQQFDAFTLLEAELKTGRTHQIRVHTSHLGFPIAGDDKYGDFELNKQLIKQGLKRMFLHAAKLVFEHPISGERMQNKAPLSDDLAKFLDTLNHAQAV